MADALDSKSSAQKACGFESHLGHLFVEPVEFARLVATTSPGAPHELAMTAVAGFRERLVKPIDPAALRAALDRFRAALEQAV